MSHGKKATAQAVLLIAGIAMVCFGVWRGEAETVLSKAIKLCLECVGIGNVLTSFFSGSSRWPQFCGLIKRLKAFY